MRAVRRAALLVCLAAALAAQPPLAGAQPAQSAQPAQPAKPAKPAPLSDDRLQARLTYAVGPGVSQCPGEERLRQEVSLRMGGDPFQPEARASVSVTVDRRGGSLVGRVVYLGPEGQRSYDRELSVEDTPCSCWSLVTSLAVATTFALTPFRPPEEAAPPQPAPCPQPRPCPLPSPRPQPRPQAPPPSAPGAPPPALPEIQLGAGGLLAVGPGKDATGGGFAVLRLRWPIVSLGLEGHLHATSGAQGDRGTPLLASAMFGALAACAHQGLLHGCAVGQLGALRLRAAAGGSPDDLHALLGAGVRAGLALPLGDHALLELRAELLGTAAPSRIRVARVGLVDTWASTIVSGALGAAALARF